MRFISTGLIILGFVLSQLAVFNYYGKTDAYTRGHDAPDHLQHISIVKGGDHTPKAERCLQCHHTPLYYWLAASIATVNDQGAITNTATLQMLSIFFYFLFLVGAILCIHLWTSSALLRVLASYLVLLWPAGIKDSVRVSNEILFYPLAAFSIFFLLYFIKKRNVFAFFSAHFFVLVSIFAKLSGVVFIPLLFIVSVVSLFQRRISHLAFAYCLVAEILLSLLPLGFSTIKGDMWARHAKHSGTLGNKASDFYTIHPLQMIETPFIDLWKNFYDYRNYWEYLLRTSLFGEFKYEGKPREIAAQVMMVSLFLLLATMLFFLFFHSYTLIENYYLFLIIGAFVVSHMLMRYKYPFPFTSDFRLIFPVIIPCVLIWCEAAKFFQKKIANPFIMKAIYFPVLTMSLTSFIFYAVLL